ncbi:unnamed protein product, partial [Heterosigma akashiwo]
MKILWLIIVLVSLVCDLFVPLTPVVEAADKSKPHKHQGSLQPYKPEKPLIKLSPKQLSILQAGKNVQQQLLQGGGGRAMVIQDVHAPCADVWARITDFPAYPKMVPKVTQCQNYEVKKASKGAQEIFTRMRLGVFGVKIEYFIRHCYYPSLSILTWTLDYSKLSDLDESVGYWYVEPHPDIKNKSDWSRVFYSVAMVPPSWIPAIVKTFLTKQALTQATAWVKQQSEMQY